MQIIIGKKNIMVIKITRIILIAFNACVFSIYGLAKLLGYQFSIHQSSLSYDNTLVKDLRPISLMWRFHAISPIYSKIIALSQLLAVLLICIPKTRKIGLIFYLFQISQIVSINFCFGLPIGTKLLSSILMLNTVFLIYTYRNNYKPLLN